MIVNHETKVIEGSSPSGSIPVELQMFASLEVHVFDLRLKIQRQ